MATVEKQNANPTVYSSAVARKVGMDSFIDLDIHAIASLSHLYFLEIYPFFC